jgi:hypothetical protein
MYNFHWRRIATIAGSLVLAHAALAQNSNGITVDVNGQQVSFNNAQPQMMGDRVMIPLRGVLEQLGANVSWDQASQKVMATGSGITITLHIGDHTAMVNGQAVNLDQPAMLSEGTTLVPLRFMSETFGASVQWDQNSQTVNIQSGAALNHSETTQTTAALQNAQTTQTAQPSTPLKFHDDLEGWTSNKSIHFVLDGTPGGQAIVILPGLSENIDMQESSAGHYEATWTPDASSPIAVQEGSAVAKLTLNGLNYYSTTLNNLNIDNTPPTITVESPVADSVISGFMPEVRVRLFDSGSGVDAQSVAVKVNGNDVSSSAQVKGNTVTYDLPASLTPGQYSVSMSVSDKAGNVTHKDWAFSITGTSATSDFVHTGRDRLKPGDQIHFSLKAPPGSQVMVLLGEGRRINLSESSVGVFTGDYTVKPLDYFVGQAVTASITPQGASAYTIRATERLGISADLPASAIIPVISSPLASQTISDPLVVAGTAPPTSTVTIHVSYDRILDDHSNTHGEIADLTVEADSAGNFQSSPIHVHKWLADKNVVFHIRATVTMPDGTVSSVAG